MFPEYWLEFSLPNLLSVEAEFCLLDVVRSTSLEPVTVTLFGQENFTGMIQWRLLRWEDYSWNSQALNGITHVLNRGKHKKLHREKKKVMWLKKRDLTLVKSARFS